MAGARMVRQSLRTSEDLLSRRYPERFLVSALASKYLILMARPKTFRTPDPQIRSLMLFSKASTPIGATAIRSQPKRRYFANFATGFYWELHKRRNGFRAMARY